MIYLLVEHFLKGLEAHGLGFLRVFTFTSFQVVAAILLSFVICISLGSRVIDWLRRQKIGDQAEFDQDEINRMMEGKKGTPTMGGVLIISSIAIATLLLANLRNFYVEMALISLVVLGGVGAADDWLKLTAAHRIGNRQGLTSLEKLLFQVGVSVILAYFTYYYGVNTPETHTLFLPFAKRFGIRLSIGAFIIISTLVMTGTSNAVNLTDGLDGLAAGCMAICSFTFCVLALIIGTLSFSSQLLLPYIPAADQMAVIAGAMMGACLGFLWFNCNPARVFMGDTGSLALGGLIGYIAIVIRQELVLFLVGGIFVIEAFSVILQVSYFKYTRRRFGEGRRIFLMSPLHHHFQRKGWTETQVVVRFWLIGAMLAAMALATVKLR
ncbi:MAG TPA: phospho-N-acetylmuramoyl-pentapeptide-transferase [Tepidisphaeraceae bacterium]|jgi:phospho-N-acetylmuramoyl-pentapeptide-transferase|nr:phospho-N-acetylmuramoyl-pentapeptide-transferase [Tepidisphaeraceae bacterium]